MEPQLTPDTFLAIAEMVAAQLRIKEADRWSPQICQLKYISFTSEFPEVSDQQFLWAAEKWLQSQQIVSSCDTRLGRRVDVCHLYRCENGLANRNWGSKMNSPAGSTKARTTGHALPAPPQKPTALPPAEQPTYQGLTKQIWQNYLKEVAGWFWKRLISEEELIKLLEKAC